MKKHRFSIQYQKMFPFSCSESVAASNAAAIDNCDNDVAITQSDEIIGADCNYFIERTFVATDHCGNTATYVQTITIIDDLPIVSAMSTDDTVHRMKVQLHFHLKTVLVEQISNSLSMEVAHL
jgi:hypothetical protein